MPCILPGVKCLAPILPNNCIATASSLNSKSAPAQPISYLSCSFFSCSQLSRIPQPPWEARVSHPTSSSQLRPSSQASTLAFPPTVAICTTQSSAPSLPSPYCLKLCKCSLANPGTWGVSWGWRKTHSNDSGLVTDLQLLPGCPPTLLNFLSTHPNIQRIYKSILNPPTPPSYHLSADGLASGSLRKEEMT